MSPVKGRASVKTTGGCGECDVRFRDIIWNTRDCYEEDEIANSLESLADAEGFEPPTSASGDQSRLRFLHVLVGFAKLATVRWGANVFGFARSWD